jgi:tRNA U34 5-carboxymethylaminomethyl modifying GTPase MnmE/TrmE
MLKRGSPRINAITLSLTVLRAPSSYTGEDVVEISAHGSPVCLESILRAAIDAGARLAEPANSRCARSSTASSI